MTHVLMTADTVGGVWTYALELVDALAPYGVEVSLATMGPPMDVEQRRAVHRSSAADVHESSFALEWMHEPWPDVDRAGEWLLELAERQRPDVVHLNGYVHAGLDWKAPTVVVAHSCVLSWWDAVHGVPAPATWDHYRRRVAAGLWAATQVVAPTRAMLNQIRRWYGDVDAVVIPNGRRSDWRTAAAKEPMVVGAGRVWDPAKNLAALDRVALRLPWPVVIAGDDEHPEDASKAAAEGARLLGRLSFPELASWLARAAVFALPARYEPFGLGPLEAAIAGCALVLGDIPSLREVWGEAALYVDPDDDDNLVAAVGELAGDPALAPRWGHRARARSLDLGPQRFGAAYHDLYRRLPVGAGAGTGRRR